MSTRVVVAWSRSILVVVISLSEGLEALLLCDRVDICANEECDNVEKWNPGVFGKEFLCKGQTQRGRDPADPHDRHESRFPRRMNLVDGLSAGNYGH